jgi:hypothetical protein
MITVSAPDMDDDRTHEFCNWYCLAKWACSERS